MKITYFVLFVSLFVLINAEQKRKFQQKPTRCLSPPAAPKKIENVINQCQDEVKSIILQEALQILREQKFARSKRQTGGSLLLGSFGSSAERRATNVVNKDPNLSGEDKRIAGCLLQCVYRKVGAVDANGWPTLEGLVSLYSEGVSEHGYFMATLKGAAICLQIAHQKAATNPDGAQRCDTAYDVFDCISDRLGEYCSSA